MHILEVILKSFSKTVDYMGTSRHVSASSQKCHLCQYCTTQVQGCFIEIVSITNIFHIFESWYVLIHLVLIATLMF